MEDIKTAMCRVTRTIKTRQEGLDFVEEMKTRLQQVGNITVKYTIDEYSFEESTQGAID